MNRIFALTVCAVAGCGEPHSLQPDAPAGLDGAVERLVLGTTTPDRQGFIPLEGDQVLVEGIQGGFHVWLKLRVAGLAPGDVDVHRVARRASDATSLLDAETTVQIGSAADGYWEQPSPLPVFLCPTPSGVTIVDQRVEVAVTLTRPITADLLGAASAVFTARCPEDARAACMQLCAR